MTQNERILRHLRDYGSISSVEAVQDYGIMRLASRISDLKKAGIPIRREMVAGKNRYGENTSYARYSIDQGGMPPSRVNRKCEQHPKDLF